LSEMDSPGDGRAAAGARTEIQGNVTNSQVYTAGRDIIIHQGKQISVTYWVRRPASQGNGFVGREAELDPLRNVFNDQGEARPRVAVISGGAGVGKSRLAAEYAHRSERKGFWSTAGAGVEQTLAALAPDLDVGVKDRTDEKVAGEVPRRLATLSPGALWVVDNLVDLGTVSSLVNAVGPTDLLVTTRDNRRRLLPSGAVFLYLEVLAPEAAVRLLCSRSDANPQDPLLGEIAEAVGRLPLALEILAVRLGEFGQSTDRLLEELEEAPTAVELEAFVKETEGASIPRVGGVFAAISGALRDLPEDVRERLSPLGYVGDTPHSC
jgi:hypothetical protein